MVDTIMRNSYSKRLRTKYHTNKAVLLQEVDTRILYLLGLIKYGTKKIHVIDIFFRAISFKDKNAKTKDDAFQSVLLVSDCEPNWKETDDCNLLEK